MKQVFCFVICSIVLLVSYSVRADNDFLAIVQYPKQPIKLGDKQLLLITTKADTAWHKGTLTLTESNSINPAQTVNLQTQVINSFSLPIGKKIYSHYLPVTVLQQGILNIQGTTQIQWPNTDDEISYPVAGFGVAALNDYAFFGRNIDDAISRMAQYYLKQDTSIAPLLTKNQQGILTNQEWHSLYKAFYLKHYQLTQQLLPHKPSEDEDRIIVALQTNNKENLTTSDKTLWNDLLDENAHPYRYLPLYFMAFDKAETNKELASFVYKARQSGTITAIVNTNGYFVAELSINHKGKAEYMAGNHYIISFNAQAGKTYTIHIKKPASAAGLYSIVLYQQ